MFLLKYKIIVSSVSQFTYSYNFFYKPKSIEIISRRTNGRLYAELEYYGLVQPRTEQDDSDQENPRSFKRRTGRGREPNVDTHYLRRSRLLSFNRHFRDNRDTLSNPVAKKVTNKEHIFFE